MPHCRTHGTGVPTAGPSGVRDPIFQVENLSLAYPGRRGQAPVPILHDIHVAADKEILCHLRSGAGEHSRVTNQLNTWPANPPPRKATTAVTTTAKGILDMLALRPPSVPCVS